MTASQSFSRFVSCTSLKWISHSTTALSCSAGLRHGDCGGHVTTARQSKRDAFSLSIKIIPPHDTSSSLSLSYEAGWSFAFMLFAPKIEIHQIQKRIRKRFSAVKTFHSQLSTMWNFYLDKCNRILPVRTLLCILKNKDAHVSLCFCVLATSCFIWRLDSDVTSCLCLCSHTCCCFHLDLQSDLGVFVFAFLWLFTFICPPARILRAPDSTFILLSFTLEAGQFNHRLLLSASESPCAQGHCDSSFWWRFS